MGDARHVSGTLSGAGVTDAREARLAEAGLVAAQGPGLLDARTGVLVGPGSTALVTGTSATGQMTVQVAAHIAATSRGSSNGLYLGPVLEAAQTVNIAAAPGSGSRIDVVYVKQQDGGSGIPSPDATTAPLYGVVTGTAASSPTKPSLSTVPGAEELGTVQVAAGATSTNGSGVTISQTARQTVARGARIPVRNQADRDALTAYSGLEVFRLDTGRVELCTSTGPTVWAYMGGNPPAIAALTGFFAGWSAYGGHAPGVLKDSSGMVKTVGAVLNGGLYDPTDGGTHTILTLPVGYRPSAPRVFAISTASAGNAAGPVVSVQIGTDGVVQVIGGTGSQVIQGAAHWLDDIPAFHPGYAGTVPLA